MAARILQSFAFSLAALYAAACATPNQVDGVSLVAADPSLREACVRASMVGGFPVPCPRLVIEHRAAKGEGCPDETSAPNRDCLEDSAAGNPNLPHVRDSFVFIQNDLVLDSALHMFVVGVKRESRLRPFRTGCGEQGGVSAPGPELLGMATTWIECAAEASGMNSGHVVLVWTRGDVVYAVSLHGHTQINRDVEFEVARNIEYVGP